MKTSMPRFAAFLTCVSLMGFASTALADVWVRTMNRLDRVSPSGTIIVSVKSAFGQQLNGVSLPSEVDALDIDRHDGSVWVFDLGNAYPPTMPPKAGRLLHISRAGVPLLQVPMPSTGVAVDQGRGGVWAARVDVGTTDPTAPGGAMYELVLLDRSSGAVKARIHGFHKDVSVIMIGADGAIWVRQWAREPVANHFYDWIRLEGSLAALNGYDVSTSESGPHHKTFDIEGSGGAVDPTDGTVWIPHDLPPTADNPYHQGEVLVLSPEGLLLKKLAPEHFYAVQEIAFDTRNGSVWLADSQLRQGDDIGANVAHYSAGGQQLAIARDWDTMERLTIDMMDRSAWAVIRRGDIDIEPTAKPTSVVKLDSKGLPIFELPYDEAIEIAGTAAMEVGIDIQPWDKRNRIDPNGTGIVTVTIMSTSWFDATHVRSDTLRFGTAGAVSRGRWLEDRNGDGRLDLLEQFRIADTGIKCGDTQATLTGRNTLGWELHATDSVETICHAAP